MDRENDIKVNIPFAVYLISQYGYSNTVAVVCCSKIVTICAFYDESFCLDEIAARIADGMGR